MGLTLFHFHIKSSNLKSDILELFEHDIGTFDVIISKIPECTRPQQGATATGVQAETHCTKGMVVFVHTKGGLMYEAAIGGQKFSYTPL